MSKLKIYLIGGDGYGWALDQDNYSLTIALKNDYLFTLDSDKADIIFSSWLEGLNKFFHHKRPKASQQIWCGVDNPNDISWPRQDNLYLINKIDLWIVYSNKAHQEFQKLNLPSLKVAKYPLSSKYYSYNYYVELVRKYLSNKNYITLLSVQRDTEGFDLNLPKRQKNPIYLYHFYKECRKKDKRIILILAGPRRHWIIKKLKEDNLPFLYVGNETKEDNAYTFLSRNDLYELYRMCDFNIVNSLWEGGPYSGVEAIWNGCINLSTDVGLMKELTLTRFILSNFPRFDAKKFIKEVGQISNTNTLNHFRQSNLSLLNSYYPSFKACYYLGNMDGSMNLIGKPISIKRVIKNRLLKPIKNIILRIKIRYFNINLGKKIISKNIKISILREFFAPPYGGGNQFMLYLLNALREQGYSVEINSFSKDIQLFIADYCWFPSDFLRKIENHKSKYNSKLIHRMDGLLSAYRNDGNPKDKFAISVNSLSDKTIVQSNFTVKQFIKAGFDLNNTQVIYNSVDKSIFKKKNYNRFDRSRIRLISASWSTNKQKGMDDYKWLDENIKSSIEYHFVGRLDFTPSKIKLFEPLGQKELSAKFQDADIFIFCANNESCPNVLLEAIACGLPVIYKDSGSSNELVKGFGIPYQDISKVPLLVDKMIDNYDYYSDLLSSYDQEEASLCYDKLIRKIIN